MWKLKVFTCQLAESIFMELVVLRESQIETFIKNQDSLVRIWACIGNKIGEFVVAYTCCNYGIMPVYEAEAKARRIP